MAKLSQFSTSELEAELARRQDEAHKLVSFYISSRPMGGDEVVNYNEKERILEFWLGSVALGTVVCLEKSNKVRILNGSTWHVCKLYNTIHPGLIHCQYQLTENETVPVAFKGIEAKFGTTVLFAGPFKVAYA